MNFVSAENRGNISLMRECASQNEIHPILTCYVGENVQNDFEFISNLIMNSNEDTFDFYVDGMEKSNMRYEQSIGFDVRSNPIFWSLLNSKIMSINENNSGSLLSFDVQKELDLVNNESILRGISSNASSKDDFSDSLLYPKI